MRDRFFLKTLRPCVDSSSYPLRGVEIPSHTYAAIGTQLARSFLNEPTVIGGSLGADAFFQVAKCSKRRIHNRLRVSFRLLLSPIQPHYRSAIQWTDL